MARYKNFPAIISGHEINYKVEIVKGVNSNLKNLIWNPSFEQNTNYWTAVGGGTVIYTDVYPKFETSCMGVDPDAGVNDGVYGDFTVDAAGQHYVSFYGLFPSGLNYDIFITDTVPAVLSDVHVIAGTGRYERYSFTYTEAGAGERRLHIVKDGSANIRTFWIDAVMVVQTAYDNLVYFDGDTAGLIPSRQDFYWEGAINNSRSIARAQTRAAGRIIDLTELGFTLKAIIGLGIGPVINRSVALADGSESYDSAINTGRTFDLIYRIGACESRELLAARRDFYRYIDTHGAPIDQPLIMYITQVSACGEPIANPLQVVCQYAGGLDGVLDNDYAEDVDVRFQVFKNHLSPIGSTGGDYIDPQLTSPAFGQIFAYSTATGLFGDMAGGAGGGGDEILASAWGPDGNLYVGGTFAAIGGVAAANIAFYDPRLDAWNAIGAGCDDTVRALCFDTTGTLFVGGDFHNSGGGPAFHLAYSTLGSGALSPLGAGADAEVFSLTPTNDGRIIIGGAFSTLNMIVSDYVGELNWLTFTFAAIGGLDGPVYTLSCDADNNVYAGGDFATAGGNPAAYVAMWDGVNWSALGAGLSDIPSGSVVSQNGSLYIVGVFATAGTVTVNGIARWDGNTWYALSSGVNPIDINSIVEDMDGRLWIGGTFTEAGGVVMPGSVAMWTGSAFVCAPFVSGDVNCLCWANETLYVGTALNATTTVNETETIVSNGTTSPQFYIDCQDCNGITHLYAIINYTTGDALYFDIDLTPQEYLTIDTGRGIVKSNYRPNVYNTVMPGSNLSTFKLAPGPNIIGMYAEVTALPIPYAYTSWTDKFRSIDETAII
jgi:hypothetical protein